jgi:antitoxin component YwqK of YwqJK toxin-antitoxin module
MKTLVIAFFVSLLFFGCGSPNLDDPKTLDNIIAQAIDEDKLQERGNEGEELFYAPNAQTPYTGWAGLLYKNGQVMLLKHFKGGRLDGLVAGWYENGQKDFEESYKDGEVDGVQNQWYENGQKRSVGNFKDGKLDGLWAVWYENGQKSHEENYREDKLVSATTWKPNGEKCPITGITEGNGVVVEYYGEGGAESYRRTFKDGKIVED